jgi:hypothetical protein
MMFALGQMCDGLSPIFPIPCVPTAAKTEESMPTGTEKNFQEEIQGGVRGGCWINIQYFSAQ